MLANFLDLIEISFSSNGENGENGGPLDAGKVIFQLL
jgi:hypothetical protein